MDEQSKPLEPLLDIEKVQSILSSISIFAGLSDKQLYRLFRLLQQVTYQDGETIFAQGTEPSYIYIVEEGKVKLVVSDDHTPLELYELGPGECFGDTAVIGIQPHAASTIAEGATRLIVLSRQALLDLYKTDLELFSTLILNIAREACRRLYKTDQILLHYVLDNKK
ncbi:cyclic nucleotide-binding domain-containing protein [Planctomycetota bacterium]